MSDCKCAVCKCDCKDCEKCKCPLSLNELRALEKLAAKKFPISRESHMKLIQFAKGFAESAEEQREIIAKRADEATKKSFAEEKPKSKRKAKKEQKAEEAADKEEA